MKVNEFLEIKKMKEQLITFDTAKLAKKAGVDIETNKFYTHRGDLCHSGVLENQSEYDGSYGAYTQSLLQMWFREKNIHVSVLPEIFDRHNICIYKWYIFNRGDKIKLDSFGIVGTYEDSLEEGLQEAFKYIKS